MFYLRYNFLKNLINHKCLTHEPIFSQCYISVLPENVRNFQKRHDTYNSLNYFFYDFVYNFEYVYQRNVKSIDGISTFHKESFLTLQVKCASRSSVPPEFPTVEQQFPTYFWIFQKILRMHINISLKGIFCLGKE